MKNLLRQLNQKPIAYYPIYRQLTGSTTSGILLSQLMYWFSKQDKFYKTDSELMEETFLTVKELKNAKSKIKELDFIDVTREGVPAKTFYRIDWEMYQTCLDFLGELDSPKGTNCIDQKGQTVQSERDKHYIYTENTHKNTIENTYIKEKDKKEFSFTLTKKTQLENTSQEYQDKLKNYISTSGKAMSYEDFYNSCLMNGYQYKNFKLAYDKWNNKPQSNQVQHYQQPQPQNTIDPFELYTNYRKNGMAREVAETRVITETGMKYPATERFLKACANAEYELYMKQREAKQSQPKESDEDYVKRVMGEL